MLIGADNKVETVDKVIKNTQKQLNDIKAGKSMVMGIGSESADKYMLRAGRAYVNGPNPSSRLQYNAGELRQSMGLDDGKKPEPLKTPTDEEEDFEDYLDRDDYGNQDEYFKAIAEHLNKYMDNGDEEGFKKFVKENKLNGLLMRDQVWERALKQKELKPIIMR